MSEAPEVTAPDEDYRKQVLARYEARSRSFAKQFSILAIFALSFLAFILVPLIAAKLEAARIDIELRDKAKATEGLLKRNEQLRVDQVQLQEEQDLLNGKLTSLGFVKAQKEQKADEARRELAGLKGELESIGAKTAELEERLRPLRATEAQMEQALKRFSPDARVTAFRQWFAEIAGRSIQDTACPDPDDWRRYFACAVQNKLHADWDEDFAVIREAVVSPLSASEPEAAQSIETEIARVREDFQRRLDEKPDFWQTIDEKLEFMETLREEWDEAFVVIRGIAEGRMDEIQKVTAPLERDIARLSERQASLDEELASLRREQAEIEAEQREGFAQAEEFARQMAAIHGQVERAQQELDDNKTELEALETRRLETENRQTDIEARIDNFQSPFGKLPLSLKEATLAFPFIITAGFLLCALLLADLIGLRREYHNQTRASMAGDPEFVRRRVAMLAPLWLDPVRWSWRSAGALVLLLHPVAIFFATVGLITSGWLLPLDTEQSGDFLRRFYDSLYVVSALLVVIGMWRVAAEWQAYRKAQARMTRPSDERGDATPGSA